VIADRGWAWEADSGAQALERLEHAGLVPDLVLSDYRLRAGESGIVAIGELRAKHGRGLPAILVTGDTAGERLVEAGESGLVVLHKPVTASRLTRALRAQLT
jgi:CheY-like chemotaxis protein